MTFTVCSLAGEVWETLCNKQSIFLPFPHFTFQNALWRHVPSFPRPSSTWSFHSAYICKNSKLCLWGSLLVPSTIKNNLSRVLFQRILDQCSGRKSFGLFFGHFHQHYNWFVHCYCLPGSLGFWRPRNTVISLKELNLNVIQICSLNELRPVIYKCPPNFQILSSDA